MRPDLQDRARVPRPVASRRSTRPSTGWRRKHDEIVVVPLLLTEAFHAKVDVPSAVAAASARHPEVQIRATPILGLEARFLEVLDLRMREALEAARARELDALVLAAAGSSDPLANQSVARLARLWGTHHKLPVTAAFASTAPPATGEAVRAFRKRGPPPHRGRLAVPGARLPAGPRGRARPRGRRRRGLRAARRPPRDRPHRPGPLRRRRRRARPRLSARAEGLET